MLQTGDVVSLLPGREAKLYDTFEGGMLSGFTLKHRRGVVTEPHRDTPTGHHVIVYNYTMTYTMVTIPAQDLELEPHGRF